MKRFVTTFFLVSNLLLAQTVYNTDKIFTASKLTVLSGAAEVITIQHLASYNVGGVTISSSNVKFISAYLYCSVACTITLERNGTAASTTAFAVSNINPKNPNASQSNTQAYSASNVGTGTTIIVYQIAAGGFISLDMTTSEMRGGVADNLTFRTNSITGTVVIEALWTEL